MSADILGTNCDKRRSMVQCCFTSTETVRLIKTESPGRSPRLSHSSLNSAEDVPLVGFMYRVLILQACQVRVTLGDSDLCCCTCVMHFEHQLTPLCVDSARALWASFCLRLVICGQSFDSAHRG